MLFWDFSCVNLVKSIGIGSVILLLITVLALWLWGFKIQPKFALVRVVRGD